LEALEKSQDGFKLAEADLELRGAGDLLGRKQWGVSDIGMEALKNAKLIQAAREEARTIVQSGALSTLPALSSRVQSLLAEMHSE
ncbi:MAG TPA: DNA helicase RecG, partial [Candidatus Paceibacterota bacterium]